MKTPTPEVLLVVFHNLSNGSLSADKHQLTKKSSYSNFNKLSKELSYSSRELSSAQATASLSSLSASSSTLNQVDNFKIYKANLIKDGAALGFVLEGGKDSPLGDKPLTIKRIFKGKHTLFTCLADYRLVLRCGSLISFLSYRPIVRPILPPDDHSAIHPDDHHRSTGGPADQEGTLSPGDELICVNNKAVYNMTRTEAWNFMKKLDDGPVSMVVRRKLYSY